MDAYDDELDLAAEDALLFGDDPPPAVAPTEPRVAGGGESRSAEPGPVLSPRVREAARLVQQQGEPEDEEEPAADAVNGPLFVDPVAAGPRRPTIRVGVSRDEVAEYLGPEPWDDDDEEPSSVRGGRRVAVAGVVAAAALAVGVLVLPSLGGGGSRSAAVASPVATVTPVPSTRTVTVTVRREASERSAPTSPRPRPARRARAKRPQLVRRPVAPAPAAVPVVRPAAPVYRPPVYRVPSAGRSADAAFGVRTP